MFRRAKFYPNRFKDIPFQIFTSNIQNFPSNFPRNFRRLEQSSKKLINSRCAAEFLELCQSFALTPTFAKVSNPKSTKWKKSAKDFEETVVKEEIQQKKTQIHMQKNKVIEIYEEIKRKSTTLRYMCFLRVMNKLNKELYKRVMTTHTRKISRKLSRSTNVDEHIKNISSFKLTFFQKLVLCRGLNFAIPRPVSTKDVQASFESAYRTLEHTLDEDKKELTVATLRSIALKYIERKNMSPPKMLLRSINQLKKRDDIVITKPDKGTGVVVMDKCEYMKLLNEASINNTEKFKSVSLERPKARGRPAKHYHPLLSKEKELENAIRKILPKEIADSICPKGSRLAHLYGLPKTHKPQLAMRPILSASGTYNFKLAKWLDEKLKPLSINKYTVSDPLKFAERLREKQMAEGDILVSYDVTSLFTNVPVDETIQLLTDKAFEKEWFNWKYKLKLEIYELVQLLKLAVKHQLFQIDGKLYEQVDGVAMGSPLGPLMANTFMCSIEEKLEEQNLMPSLYHRFVDVSITSQRSIDSAEVYPQQSASIYSIHYVIRGRWDITFLGHNPH